MRTTSSVWRGSTLVVCAGSLVGGLIGCKDLTGSGQLPAGTPNPSIYNSASGAVGLRNAAVYGLEGALSDYIRESGLLTDELQDKRTGASAGVLSQSSGVSNPLDERILPEGVTINNDVAYGELQQARGAATLAMRALATYDTAATDTAQQHVWRAELHADIGYIEILLADLYCSGVPLSTLDFQGDFTYQPGSSTAQLYQTARAEEDSALSLAGAGDSVSNLARVLKGRASLALGQYVAARDDVTTIPTTFQYTVLIHPVRAELNWLNQTSTIADQEGGDGLSYRSSGDPRSADSVVCAPTATNLLYDPANCSVDTLTYPMKYAAMLGGGGTDFPVATGVEARLIEAEAALQAGDASWLTILNTLRTACTTTTSCPTPAPAGTGGVAGLPPLSDPGATLSGTAAATARIALLFQERAFWLFLTGHRQGDLRRLLRQYSQYPAFASQQLVYPSGPYLAPGTGLYGSFVNVPVPQSETPNPDFHGCRDRNP